jgi:hypothetical protein
MSKRIDRIPAVRRITQAQAKVPLQLQALIKYLASFARRDWQLEDYPVRISYQGSGGASLPNDRSQQPMWCAEILNWWTMLGTGDSRQAALADLRHNFEEYKRLYVELPRPGTRAPLLFAVMVEISRYETIAREYFRRVLDLDYEDCFVSDESRLEDFFGPEDYVQKTQRVYGVDISDIQDGNLVDILKRLQERGVTG